MADLVRSRIGELTMQAHSCSLVGGSGLFGCIEHPKEMGFLIGEDCRVEPSISMALNASGKACLIGRTTIPTIFFCGGFSKVVPTVILRVSVFVVNLRRLLARHYFPNYARCAEDSFINADSVSTLSDMVSVQEARGLISVPTVPSPKTNIVLEMFRRPSLPDERPYYRVIIQALDKVRLIGQSFRSHVVPRCRNGWSETTLALMALMSSRIMPIATG